MLYLTYLLPTFPFVVMQLEMQKSENHKILGFLLSLVMWSLVTPLAVALLTVCVSDICLGNRPSMLRSLRRVFGFIFGKLLLTNLLSGMIIMLGFVLLMIPGIFFYVWWMFVPTVIMIERISGWSALKRSKALGKGYYVRNCFIVLLLYVSVVLLASSFIVVSLIVDSRALRLLGAAIQCVLLPLPLIATVLIYYELRVRSEGYGIAMLGQDLRR